MRTAEADRIGPYLTLLRGIRFEEENIEWAGRALTVIEQRLAAGTDPTCHCLMVSEPGRLAQILVERCRLYA